MRRLAVALAWVIAGCGGDDTATGTSSDTSSGAGTGTGGDTGGSSSATTSASTSMSATSASSASTGDSGVTGSGEVCGGTCVAELPAGWQGPFEVHTAAGEPPGCDPGYAMDAERLADFVAPAGTCGCDCGQPSGVTCSDEVLHISNNFSCDGASDLKLAPGQCMANPPIGVSAYFTATASQAQGGTCDASITPSLAPPDFSTAVRVCAPAEPLAQAGCDAGSLCAPARADGARLCIAQDGDVACPAGFGDRIVTYTGATDTRTCPDASACECTVDAKCTGDIKTYVTTDCTKSSHLYGNLEWAQCVALVGPLKGVAPGSIGVTVTPGGSCIASGDVPPEGTVTPDAPRTFCCQS